MTKYAGCADNNGIGICDLLRGSVIAYHVACD